MLYMNLCHIGGPTVLPFKNYKLFWKKKGEREPVTTDLNEERQGRDLLILRATRVRLFFSPREWQLLLPSGLSLHVLTQSVSLNYWVVNHLGRFYKQTPHNFRSDRWSEVTETSSGAIACATERSQLSHMIARSGPMRVNENWFTMSQGRNLFWNDRNKTMKSKS